ncbi:MAG TPA: mechanosensitive ion channel domain-containing protein [Steroidobacteraceae bacterium]|jgi:small-conductance mechanosensitive channel|nr:mechanosensitive ion channel domain-containing protein [Steroidobacteraceae bacterium]
MNTTAAVDSASAGPVILIRALILDVAGPAAQRPVIGSFSALDLGSIVVILVLAALVSTALAILARQRARHGATTTRAAPLRHLAAFALGTPAQVFVGGCALYLSLGVLLPHIAPPAAISLFQTLFDSLARVGAFAIIVWLIYRLTHVLESWLSGWAARTQTRIDDLVLPLLGRSARVMLPVLGAILMLPILELPERFAGIASRATSIVFIGAVAAVLLQATRTGEQALLRRYDLAATDNLRARTVYTQVRVIGKVIDVGIALVTIACVLMLFAEVRQVGASLLASAGVVGIIAGIAAQKTLGNLFAGFQIALAQPMRQDDVVVVEGEWGRIEEITLTYVVIHIWDDRRLIVPLSYFIEKPFANWTRSSAQILGQVIVWVDYSFPVEEGRGVLKDIIESSSRWDRRFWNLQVTDTSERTMQLRVLATSTDSATNFDLRCEIREKFIACIQTRWPHALPQWRAQLARGAESAPL